MQTTVNNVQRSRAVIVIWIRKTVELAYLRLSCQQNDNLRLFKNNLDITVNWYNKIVQSTIEVPQWEIA